MDSRLCPKCNQVRPSADFPGRTNSYCKPCHNAYARAWRKANPDRVKQAKRKHIENTPEYTRRQFLARHKLTPERFAELFAEQGNRCAICSTPEPNGNGWHIDHDHTCCPTSTGRRCGKCYRGILCSTCNTGLGHFKDDPERLRSALRYLEHR